MSALVASSNGMGQFCIEVNESASEIDKTTEALKAQTIWLMFPVVFQMKMKK